MLTRIPSETTSIPTNPRTTRPVGYAFVDLSTADEAQKAIADLAGKFILDRKVSVQLARKPETAAEKQAAAASGGEGVSGGEGRRRNSGRGRGRGRTRGGRTGRGGRSVSCHPNHTPTTLMTDTCNSLAPSKRRGRYERPRSSLAFDRDYQRGCTCNKWNRRKASCFSPTPPARPA